MRFSIFIALSFFLVRATVSYAADYYLSSTGSDANPGTLSAGQTQSDVCASTSRPWKTLKKCLDTSASGDRCLICPGTHQGQPFAFVRYGGSSESNNLLSNCTCTSKVNSISCGSAIPATVNAGDYVQCDSGYGFSWSKVASISGSTITLAEPYRGATSTLSGSDTLDVARFTVVAGLGATPRDTVLSHWHDAPASVNWTLVPGYSDVWSYDPAAVVGTDDTAKAWRARWCSNDFTKACTSDGDCGAGNTCRLFLKGIRDENLANWDTWWLPINNGIEGYNRLGSTANDPSYGTGGSQDHQCPGGYAGRSHIDNVGSSPGSYAYDVSGANPKIYVHTRKRCSGGIAAGHHCLIDSDCDGGGTCAASQSPANYRMQAAVSGAYWGRDVNGSGGFNEKNLLLRAQKPYVIVENIALDGGYHGIGGQGGSANFSTLDIGASNSRYSNIEVLSGFTQWSFTANDGNGQPASTDNLFDSIKARGGNRCTGAGTGANSGLKFYNVEMRGTSSQTFNCNTMRGAAKDDRIVFDRCYFHRLYPNLSTAACGAPGDNWDVNNDRYLAEIPQYLPGHGPYWGNKSTGGVMCNVMVRNTVTDMVKDGIGLFGQKSGSDPNCTDNIFVNNTFNGECGPSGCNETLAALTGTSAGNSAPAILYNNMFLAGWNATSYWMIDRAGTAPSDMISDYNLFVHYNFTASNGSLRVWNPPETLSYVISNYGKENNSILVCKTGCANASPGAHRQSPSSDPGVVDGRNDDGDPADYTPKAGSWAVDAGAPNATYQCPEEDFYGNRRTNRCDIGAVEFGASGGSDRLPPAPPQNLRIN